MNCSNCCKPEHNKTTCQAPFGSKLINQQQQISGNNNLTNVKNNAPRNDLFAQTFGKAINPNTLYCVKTQQVETQIVPKKRGRPKQNQPFERNEQSFL